MPDNKGGAEHFKEAADARENKSSSSRFASHEVIRGKGGDGPLHLEIRGEPKAKK